MKCKSSFFLLIYLFLCCCGEPAVEKKKQINTVDLLTGNSWMYQFNMGPIDFRDSAFMFVAERYMDTIHPIYGNFHFMKNGTLTYKVYAPGSIFCGNGLLFLEDASWKLNDDHLELKLDGGYSLDYHFTYDIVYRIDSINERSLKLVKEREVSVEKKRPYYLK